MTTEKIKISKIFFLFCNKVATPVRDIIFLILSVNPRAHLCAFGIQPITIERTVLQFWAVYLVAILKYSR